MLDRSGVRLRPSVQILTPTIDEKAHFVGAKRFSSSAQFWTTTICGAI